MAKNTIMILNGEDEADVGNGGNGEEEADIAEEKMMRGETRKVA